MVVVAILRTRAQKDKTKNRLATAAGLEGLRGDGWASSNEAG